MRRIPVPTAKELHTTIVPASEPVIIEGAIDHWELRSPPLSEAALVERLIALCGKREVRVATAPRDNRGLFGYGSDQPHGQNFTERDLPLAEFLEVLLRDNRARYVRSQAIRDSLPELLPLFPLEHLVGDKTLFTGTPRLWLGNGGHRVPLHYDRDDNLLCLAAGTKRFLLFPHDALPGMYIGGFGHEPGGVATALVDALAPDHDRFPRYRDVEDRVLVADLAPGEVLYIPAYWWHHVESSGLNMAATFWWCRTPIEDRLAAEAALVHGVLSLRSQPPYLREVYRNLFEYFVFERSGEPYAHIPQDALQGWAGRATPERVRGLREKLRLLLDSAGVLGTSLEVDLDHRHTLVTGIAFHLVGDNVEIRGDFRPIVVPYDVFELIREFTTPIAPRAVAKRRAPRKAATRRDLERLFHAFVLRGLLVDCEPV